MSPRSVKAAARSARVTVLVTFHAGCAAQCYHKPFSDFMLPVKTSCAYSQADPYSRLLTACIACGQVRGPKEKFVPELKSATYHASNFMRATRRWLMPYVQSRVLKNQFRPLLSYLFTEYKCNVDCHYCWAYNNKVKGMTEETAFRSIDFLKEHGCRVVALMGGEPLLR